MDVNYWLDNVEVSSSAIVSESGQAAAAAMAVASALDNTIDIGDDYFRVGRRTIEDVNGDIPTQHIVVAKVDAAKRKVVWLSVATWQFNGLRIGSIHAGDRIKEDDENFDFSTGFDPDPYFFARNLSSPPRVREHLLQLLSQGQRQVQAETLDDDIAHIERDEALSARLALEGVPVPDDDEDVMRAVFGQDPKERFPHPWALPVVLTDSWDTSFIGIKPGPTRARRKHAKQKWLPDFDSIGDGSEIPSVNAMAVFVNDFEDRNLGLKHFVEIGFGPDESFESTVEYFLEGDETAESGFRGLNSNGHLAQLEWSLELWILPQKERCSTLILWNDVPQLQARAFCDWRAIRKDGAAKLYIEVRIVEKKPRVVSPIESEAAVASD